LSKIAIPGVRGRVKASTVQDVSDFVDKHPDESIAILRAWLHDGS
jgi:flagellar M-ring protein FliF